MAFHTNVLRNGEWVTETVNLHAVLKSQKTAGRGSARKDLLAPPQCGLLTRTVVESPLANSILPVRLRSRFSNDIAIVGDRFVQICELRKDGRLKDVVRKNDFGCRIRNACVIGSVAVPELTNGSGGVEPSGLPRVKTEDGYWDSSNSASTDRSTPTPQLPPQLLMVVLETGDTIFMFARSGPDGRPELVSSRFGWPGPPNGYPGFHLAIDPSSRYLALAGPSDYFVVYELKSHTQLSEAYSRGEPLHPVRCGRLRSVRGVIHKIAFLHPRPGDVHHIILLLIVVSRGKSRTVIYEWELGDDLTTALGEERQGHRMPVEHQMPLLLVPLTFNSAFLAVSPDHITICTGCLYGPPVFENFNVSSQPPTANHRARHKPLWTAWARPFRLQSFSNSCDCIYIAREDGAVLFIEVDRECDLSASTVIGPVPCNISTAFTCIFDHSTDVLVVGSDSGPGGCWKIPPRKAAELLDTLPNWSPAVDFTTTAGVRESIQDARQEKGVVPALQSRPRNPDRVFVTCEAGTRGSITEYRYGLKANIGLDLEYGTGVKQAWLLSSPDPTAFDGYMLLLSMPDSTAVLFLPSDFSLATAPAHGTVPYDLSSTTLALSASGQLFVQVTKDNVVLAARSQSVRLEWRTLPQLGGACLSDACIMDDCLAISVHREAHFQLHIFKIDQENITVAHVQSLDVDGEITCLSLGPGYSVLAGIREAGRTYLARGSLQQGRTDLEKINLTEHLKGREASLAVDAPVSVEGIASIVSVRGTILLGTRSGELMVVKDHHGSVSVECEKLGMTTANLCYNHRVGEADPRVLVCCDNMLLSLVLGEDGTRPGTARIGSKFRVWPVDAGKPEAPPPPVAFASIVDMPSSEGTTSVLMISGARLLLAEVHDEPGPAHRSIPVEGCPNRVMYSRSMQCLVVALNRQAGPNLVLLDPDNGEDIGRPTDRNGEALSCISGLGKEGDRILGLTEWNYRRDSSVWNFILVVTRTGRLIVVTTQKAGRREDGRPAIRYWTRFRKEVKEPIYSVVGYDQGLIYCFGQTIQWEVLDAEQRRLKALRSFSLNSPVTALRISHGKLLALTSTESLVVLDHVDSQEDDGNDENNNHNNDSSNGITRLRHVDPWRRNGVDFIEVAGPRLHGHPTTTAGDSGGRGESIVLVADRECGVTGLWVPWKTPERECEVVFEAELPASVRRFRLGRTRPQWRLAGGRPRYGRPVRAAVAAAAVDDAADDGAEILGIALNGAMYQFTLLSIEVWRLLRFVQNLAVESDEVCPFSAGGHSRSLGHHHHHPQQQQQFIGRCPIDAGGGGFAGGIEWDPEPRLEPGLEMHVDGDILQRCLETRALERLVVREAHVSRFLELLDELDRGEHTAGWGGDRELERYFRLAYDVLEYYLLPVL